MSSTPAIRDGRTAITVVVAVIAALLAGAAPAQAQPQTYTVTTTSDVVTGPCGATCSLRDAVRAANGTVDEDTIVVPGGTYVLDITGAGEDAAATGDLDVTADVIIVGAGSGATVIDASGIADGDRALHTLGTTSMTLEGLTVTGGDVTGQGGGIFLQGDGGALTTTDVDVIDNEASEDGGGTAARGDGIVVTMTDGVVSSNVAGRDGGGLQIGSPEDGGFHIDVTLALDRMRVGSTGSAADLNAPAPGDANQAGDSAGGVWVAGEGVDVSIVDSMIDGNRAANCCAGVFALGRGNALGSLVVERSSISRNGAAASSGGIQTQGLDATYTDSSIDGNHAELFYGGLASVRGRSTLVGSSIDGNTVGDDGLIGGALSFFSRMVFERSSISGNDGGKWAGGLHHLDASASGDPALEPLVGLVLIDSTVADNTAGTYAGVINDGSSAQDDPFQGELLIEGSTFSGNVASVSEGGALFTQGSFAEIVNSTFSGNEALEGGGAYVRLSDTEDVLIRNTTFADSASRVIKGQGGNPDIGGKGDALYVVAGTGGDDPTGEVQVVNSIFADSARDNCAVAAGAAGMLVSLGHNIDDDRSCEFTATGDREVDPLLGPLAANGGATATHLPLAGSPAIDAADAGAAPNEDQRGVGRPQGAGVDVGAVEVVDPDTVIRLGGKDRIETGIEVSRATFGDGEAPAVVLARGDIFPDALAGTPLALDLGAPLLLTWPNALDARTEAEIQRILPTGSTVVLLGGAAALAPSIEARIQQLGYETTRFAGKDRFATAVDIADRGLGNPGTLFLATGWDFADALAGGTAADRAGAAVLLTAGDDMHGATQAYLDSRPGATRFALGGPASRADASATPLVGPTRFQTAVAVAEAFFDDPTVAGVARSHAFPDALTGGAHVGRQGGPMLLSTTASLHATPRGYLEANRISISLAYLYGGVAALAAQVEGQTLAAIQ